MDYIDPKATKASIKILQDKSIKIFKKAIEKYSKTKDIVFLDEVCNIKSYTVAVFVNIADNNLNDLIDVLRKIDIVQTIET